jgi:anti-anti-sigma regulatory factor
MSAQAFAGEIRHRDGAAVLDLSGDISASPASVVLNFEGVGYINSTGIALIVGLLAEARRARQTVLAIGLSPHYQEIFQVTRLADFMPMFADEDAALAGAPSPAGTA